MRKSKFTESQIIKAIKANENGQRAEDLCGELGKSTILGKSTLKSLLALYMVS